MDTRKLKSKGMPKNTTKPVAVFEGKITKKVKSKKRHKKKTNALYIVNERQFKTRKKTYKISTIEKTEIRKNLILLLPISLLSLLFTYKFWDYLYRDEVIFIISASVIMGIASLFLGTLYIYSKALGEPAAFGFVPTLRKVRNKIDDYMMDLEEEEYATREIEEDD